MRVRHLQTYLSQSGLTRRSDVSQLRGCRVGIDVTHWLRSFDAVRDPVAEALGGVDVEGLLAGVAIFLKQLRDGEVTPVVVFPGVPPKHRVLCFGNHKVLSDEAWVKSPTSARAPVIHDIQTEIQSNPAAGGPVPSHLLRLVFEFLTAEKVECLGAPFISGPQLSFMKSTGQIDEVYGPCSALLFGVRRVVVRFVFGEKAGEGEFEWAEAAKIYKELDITRFQFLNAVAMAGTEFCFTLPYLNLGSFHGQTHEFTFATALDFAKQAPLSCYMKHFPSEKMRKEHAEGYSSCMLILNRCVVLDAEAVLRVVSFDNESLDSSLDLKLPASFEKYVGRKLPPALIGLMATGLLSYHLPMCLVQQNWVEVSRAAFETFERREVELELRSLKRRILGLLTASLSKTYQNQPIYFSRRIESNSDSHSEPAEGYQPLPPTFFWNFTAESVTEELRRQDAAKVDVGYCLSWHVNSPTGPDASLFATKPLMEVKSGTHAQALVYFRLLELLQYFDGPNCGVTVFGSAVRSVSEENRVPMLIALELLKLGLITGDQLAVPRNTPQPPNATICRNRKWPSNRVRSVILLSRVFSLVTPRGGQQWQSEVDLDLARYHAVVSLVVSCLNSAAEASVAFTTLQAARVNSDFKASSFFGLNPIPLTRCVLGVLAKFFLELGDDEIARGAEHIQATLRKNFPATEDPLGELRRGAHFWSDFVHVFGVVAQYTEVEALHKSVKEADDLLRARLSRVGIERQTAS